MGHCMCSRCGYRKSQREFLDYTLETNISPFFDITPIMPFRAMGHMLKDSIICPNCGGASYWEDI